MNQPRISRRRLEEFDHILADRDKDIIRSLQMCRYLVSGQIKRLHFTDHASHLAALRATNRGLLKLQGYGLINCLERRIGGVRAGSGAYVWFLTEAGDRFMQMKDTADKPRKRFFEPSPTYLSHTLAVSEARVQLDEICRTHKIELVTATLEPTCWKSYIETDGRPAYLKPDLQTTIINGDYEDNYFIEIDLDTEAPCIVVDKCKRYATYYRRGTEQRSGVFPLVVWVVPSAARKERLQRNIAGCKELNPKEIFVVITADEFETLLVGGVDALRQDDGDGGGVND